MKSDIGIVIVNWNSGKELKRCLESIESSGYIENVVVVNNGADYGNVDLSANHESLIKIIKNEENLGYGEGNNEGIKYFLDKKKKFILILNPDTQIYKDTIPNLLEALKRDKRIGIVGPKIFAPNDNIWSCGGVIDKKRYSAGLIGLGEKDKGQYDQVREVDFISGTAMMVRREVFMKIGVFEPSYFMYYEDVEFCKQAKKAGFKVMYVPTSQILHRESSSIGKNSPAQAYYMARNHLLFVERNAPVSVKLRELIRLPKTVFDHWQKREMWAMRGIRDYFTRRFGKCSGF